MADAKVKITGNIEKSLNKLIKKLEDPKQAFRKIAQLEVSETKLRFRESEDPEGNQWQNLSPFTIAKRRQESDKPLVDTGRLRNSITSSITNKDIFIGTNVVYAKLHQFGGKVFPFGNRRANKVNVPARPFLGVNEKTEKNVRNVLKRFLDL